MRYRNGSAAARREFERETLEKLRQKTRIKVDTRPEPHKRPAYGLHPAPVYVATLAGGETIRMSFWSHPKKPLDFDSARKMVLTVIGAERARAAFLERHEGKVPLANNREWLWGCDGTPASDIVSGHVERKDRGHEGEVAEDPFFAPKAATVHRAKRKAAAAMPDNSAELAAARAELERALERIALLEDAIAWERTLTRALAA